MMLALSPTKMISLDETLECQEDSGLEEVSRHCIQHSIIHGALAVTVG